MLAGTRRGRRRRQRHHDPTNPSPPCGGMCMSVHHLCSLTRRHPRLQDIFLLAAERLGVPIQDCVVFEDAPMGFEAARRAGE